GRGVAGAVKRYNREGFASLRFLSINSKSKCLQVRYVPGNTKKGNLMEGILSLEEVMDGTIPPILAEHLMPSFFGLQWNTAFANAVETLAESIVYQKPDLYLIVNRSIGGKHFEFDLYFNEEGLFRINADLFVSDSFWEIEDEEERMRTRLDDKLQSYYTQLA